MRQATQVSRPPPSASNDEHDDLLRLPGLRGPNRGELRHVGELALPQVGLDDLLEDVAQRRLVLRVHIGDVLEAAGEVDDHLADALLVEQPHLPLLRPAVLRDGVEHPERVPASVPLGVRGGWPHGSRSFASIVDALCAGPKGGAPQEGVRSHQTPQDARHSKCVASTASILKKAGVVKR